MPCGLTSIIIGDVSGHGLGAALVMAETRAYLRALALNECDPGKLLVATNKMLHADLEDERFVTLFCAQLNIAGRCLVYANAGHPPCFVLDSSDRSRQHWIAVARRWGCSGRVSMLAVKRSCSKRETYWSSSLTVFWRLRTTTTMPSASRKHSRLSGPTARRAQKRYSFSFRRRSTTLLVPSPFGRHHHCACQIRCRTDAEWHPFE